MALLVIVSAASVVAQEEVAVGDVVYSGPFDAYADLYVESVSAGEGETTLSLYFYNTDDYFASRVLIAGVESRPSAAIQRLRTGSPFSVSPGRRRDFSIAVPSEASEVVLKLDVDGYSSDVRLVLDQREAFGASGYGVHDLTLYVQEARDLRANQEWRGLLSSATSEDLDRARRFYFDASIAAGGRASPASRSEVSDLETIAQRIDGRPFLYNDPLLRGLLDSARTAAIQGSTPFSDERLAALDDVSQQVEGVPFFQGYQVDDLLQEERRRFLERPEAYSPIRLAWLDQVTEAAGGGWFTRYDSGLTAALDDSRRAYQANPYADAFSSGELERLDAVANAVVGVPFLVWVRDEDSLSPLAWAIPVLSLVFLVVVWAVVQGARRTGEPPLSPSGEGASGRESFGQSGAGPPGPPPPPKGSQGGGEDINEGSLEDDDPVVSSFVTLGLSPSASRAEVDAAREALVRKYHPDRVAHLGPDFKALAEGRLSDVFEAYEIARRHAR